MPRISAKPSKQALYNVVLASFMSYRDGKEYDKTTIFTPPQLLEITPDELKEWMCFKVYVTPHPGPDDMPTQGRASSLEYYKKAISFHMPSRNRVWDTESNKGNPTRSIECNDLICLIKKQEVRKQAGSSTSGPSCT
jgi:hypothetical protein